MQQTSDWAIEYPEDSDAFMPTDSPGQLGLMAESVDTALSAIGAGTGVQSYTPALTAPSTNPTLGTGSQQVGRWLRIGDLVFVWARIRFGTSGTNAGSGLYRISLPLPADLTVYDTGTLNATMLSIGSGYVRDNDNSSNHQSIDVALADADNINMGRAAGGVSHNSPFSWAAQDGIAFHASYIAASA